MSVGGEGTRGGVGWPQAELVGVQRPAGSAAAGAQASSPPHPPSRKQQRPSHLGLGLDLLAGDGVILQMWTARGVSAGGKEVRSGVILLC